MTDVYNTVADRRASRTLSDDIVIVSIDGCSREDIMEVVDYVDYLNPSAIGLDVFFNYPAEGDAGLIESLTQCDNLVFPVGLRRIGDEAAIFGSYFMITHLSGIGESSTFPSIHISVSSGISSRSTLSAETP